MSEPEYSPGAQWKPESKVPVFSEICLKCRRLTDGMAKTCEAFPSGIPDEIWSGDNDHTQPYEGDGGLMFVSRFGAQRDEK